MNTSGDSILLVRDVSSGYGQDNILREVSISVERGGFAAIIGPNGSGKSTLLKTIYGLVGVRGGTIVFRSRSGASHSLGGMRPHSITMLGINYVPQISNVFSDMSVYENLEMGSFIHRGAFVERLELVLGTVPALKVALNKRAATLSGGQRQMLALARALMSDPELLILDEPSAGLSPLVVDEVFAKIKDINQTGVSVLIVEQKAEHCLLMSDFGYVHVEGKNAIQGTGAELLDNPEVVKLYLGGRGKFIASGLRSV